MSAEMPPIDIHPDHWKIVQRILQEHVPDLEVWAFGSRAKGSAKESSDLDLAIITDEPLPIDTSLALNEAFSESDLPWKVDVVDWSGVSGFRRSVIENGKVVIQEVAYKSARKIVTLGEICQEQNGCIQTGPFGSQLHAYDYSVNGTPVVMPVNIVAGRINELGIARISDSHVERLIRHKLEPGDIVFSRRGDVTRFALVSNRESGWVCGTGCLKVAIGTPSMAIPRYIAAVLSTRDSKEWLERHAVGATMPNLNTEILAALPVVLPPIHEQRAIAHILGVLDDKIELNRKQNETLEAMARAMFKAWFVDFEPVRAKMEGRWKRGQSLPGMPANLYDLFPDRMVESELGEIPEGWGVAALRDVCSYISRGISPKYIDFGGVAVVNQKCIRDFSIDFSKTRRHDASKRKIDDRLLKLWDVLVNSTGVGTLGRVAQVRRLPEAIIVDSHVTVLRAGVEINPLYLGLVVGGMQQEIEALAEGSTGQTELSRAKLGELKILLPKNEVLDGFHDFMKSIFDGASSNQTDSDVLARIRDTLLSELVSGRLRVPVSLLNLRGAL